MKTLIRHARVVSPDFDVEGASLLLENGRILAVIDPAESMPASDVVIDAGERLAMPGFFDIHSHGADGRDVCDGTLDSVRHIARRKLLEGVTTWLPTTLTQPADRLLETASACAAYRAAPDFCRTPGLHVEGPFINAKNAGAQNPEFIRQPDFAELLRIHETCPAAIVSLAPELPEALDLIRSAAALGIRVSAAHTSATAVEIAAAKVAGLVHLTHFANAMTPLHHREIGTVGAGLMDDSLLLEIIADGIHLCPDMLRLVFKLVSIDRLMLITDSTAASWLGEGTFHLGGRPVTVENHIARLADSRVLAGSTLKYNEGVKRIFEATGMPLAQIVKATSWNQTRSLGLDGYGKLAAGYQADIVLLEKDFSVWKTFVAGKDHSSHTDFR